MDLGINIKQLQDLFDPKDEESSDDDQVISFIFLSHKNLSKVFF